MHELQHNSFEKNCNNTHTRAAAKTITIKSRCGIKKKEKKTVAKKIAAAAAATCI